LTRSFPFITKHVNKKVNHFEQGFRMQRAKIFIGTSGWSYPNWRSIFYPPKIKGSEQLHFYAEHFDTVEINSTFYRLPTEKAVQNWATQVPEDFIFAIKGSRFITHTKRLTDYALTTGRLFEKIELLGERLGPILFQLPSHFKKDAGRLEEFLHHLPQRFRYTFEFREISWFTDEVYDLLQKYHIALCITDLKGWLSPIEVTSPFTYIRLHGPKLAYQGAYGAKRLEEWKKRINDWSEKQIEVYCYFDNTDFEGHALKDAMMLKRMVGEKT
jgi:uncharacterized protein YecE (DUF72 family)